MLQPIVKMINEPIPSLCVHEWYLDKGAELHQVIDIVKTHGSGRGLMLSTSKATVWCPSQTKRALLDASDTIGCGVSLVAEEGIIVLGSLIGSIAFQREANSARLEKLETFLASFI